jgi:hypothetical protein
MSYQADDAKDSRVDAIFECDECSDMKCAVCGHIRCPVCVDDCDHPDCIVWDKYGGTKTHECQFGYCETHKPKETGT